MNQRGVIRLVLLVTLSIGAIYFGSAILGKTNVQAASKTQEVKSGIGDDCLSVSGSISKGAAVELKPCNGSEQQAWQMSSNHLVIGSYCLSPLLQLGSCQQAVSWHGVGTALEGSNNKCLTAASLNQSVVWRSCDSTLIKQSWTQTSAAGEPLIDQSSPACKQKQVGQRVACYANRQWTAWQLEPNLRPSLLNDYTDGNPYEEWCADFVSYLYNEAGAPFTQGERSGWDEYNANNIQNMGFVYHAADSGYIPRAGDVAYFNYNGGHVEIVEKGGVHPVFIYGDSGAIDPISQNGSMAENQITSDGANGHLVYYLSPINN